VIYFLFAAALAQGASALPEPDSIKDFEMICYCGARVGTPHGVVAMDDNGRILSAARRPITKEQLIARGIPVEDSQLRVLRDWGLLDKSGDRYVARMGIFGPTEMGALRARLAPLVTKAVQANRGHFDAIAAELRRRGHSDAAHTIAFSYVLDGLLWEQLKKMGKMSDVEPNIDHPYWNGTFWAVFPKPASAPGTNSFTKSGVELQMMWKNDVVRFYQPVADDPEIGRWLESLGSAPHGVALPPPNNKLIARAIVINERNSDPLYLEGLSIAQSVADILASQDFSDIMSAQSDSDRVIIAAHEFIWRALDEISRQPGFGEPAALARGTDKLSDVAPLLIVSIKK
jgi:hypothetical protein